MLFYKSSNVTTKPTATKQDTSLGSQPSMGGFGGSGFSFNAPKAKSSSTENEISKVLSSKENMFTGSIAAALTGEKPLFGKGLEISSKENILKPLNKVEQPKPIMGFNQSLDLSVKPNTPASPVVSSSSNDSLSKTSSSAALFGQKFGLPAGTTASVLSFGPTDLSFGKTSTAVIQPTAIQPTAQKTEAERKDSLPVVPSSEVTPPSKSIFGGTKPAASAANSPFSFSLGGLSAAVSTPNSTAPSATPIASIAPMASVAPLTQTTAVTDQKVDVSAPKTAASVASR